MIGIVTSGICYQYVKEALPDASVLKLGLVNPLPRKLIEDFAAKVETLYIVEELDPLIELQVKSWGIKAVGKEIFTVQGEYSANMLRKAILKEDLDLSAPAQVPMRPPILCPGCPHRSVYSVLNRLGASISTLHGMEKAKGKEYIKNWVAVIGDSTFMHTGVNSLINMVYNQGTGTVMILDNSTTGMTGHQDHAATGKTLQGDVVPAINIVELCKSLGIKNVEEVNAFDTEKLAEVVKREVAKDEVSVIITKSPCVLLNKTPVTKRCVVDPVKCKQCGACLRPGCPAITKGKDGFTVINDTMCNGCGLCKQLCKFDAIGEN